MHSYIVSPLAFKHIAREEFGKLQNKVFPSYFVGQAIAPIILGLTAPAKFRMMLPVLAASAIAGALNRLWLLPVCHKLKDDLQKLTASKEDEVIVDGKIEPSAAYKAVKKQFGMYHGLSMLCNTISIVTLGAYGVGLATKL